MNPTNQRKSYWGNLLGTISCLVLIAVPFAAQSQDRKTVQGSKALEEITVTAQRRKENLQSVPIYIDAFSGTELDKRGVDSVMNLNFTVPNLTNQGSIWSITYIRGIGSASASQNNEPGVGTYVDGVYNGVGTSLAALKFNNIERVEVLKGPQGTLFGRNVTGGVIQIITKDPSHELGGDLRVGYGNYQTTDGALYLTGGVSDKLAADFAVVYENNDKGWGRNLTTGQESYIRKTLGLRTKWLYEPSDATAIRFSIDYNDMDWQYHIAQLPGTLNKLDGVTTDPGEKYASVQNRPGLILNTAYSAALTIDHDFDKVHFVSISSYRDVDGVSDIDGDLTPTDFLHLISDRKMRHTTQEFHLENKNPGKTEWLVGLFYFHSETDQATFTEGLLRPPGGRTDGGNAPVTSASIFGQTTTEISENTKLTLGLRYTTEDLDVYSWRKDGDGNFQIGPSTDSTSNHPWTWRLAVDHQFSPDVLGYISYNHGFHSGGFNLSASLADPFLAEELDAYEVGLKSELLDKRLRLNAAAFYYDYTDIQLTTSVGASSGGQIFTNAGGARMIGLDLGLDYLATEKLKLSVGVGLLDGEYTEYFGGSGFDYMGNRFIIDDAKGVETPNSPPFTGYVNVDYRTNTASGSSFGVSVNLAYTDRFIITPTDLPYVPAHENLNVSIEWRPPSDAYGFELWGENLTDSYYPGQLLSGSNRGWYANYAPPRMYGLRFLKNFGTY